MKEDALAGLQDPGFRECCKDAGVSGSGDQGGRRARCLQPGGAAPRRWGRCRLIRCFPICRCRARIPAPPHLRPRVHSRGRRTARSSVMDWREIPGDEFAFDKLKALVEAGEAIAFVGAGVSADLIRCGRSFWRCSPTRRWTGAWRRRRTGRSGGAREIPDRGRWCVGSRRSSAAGSTRRCSRRFSG